MRIITDGKGNDFLHIPEFYVYISVRHVTEIRDLDGRAIVYVGNTAYGTPMTVADLFHLLGCNIITDDTPLPF